jgi:hypothetical protein
LNNPSLFYPTIDLNLSKPPMTLTLNQPGMTEFFIGIMKKFSQNSIPELKLIIPPINPFVPTTLSKQNKSISPNNKKS